MKKRHVKGKRIQDSFDYMQKRFPWKDVNDEERSFFNDEEEFDEFAHKKEQSGIFNDPSLNL